MTGIIVTSPPTIQQPPSSSGGGSAVLPGVTYTYASVTLRLVQPRSTFANTAGSLSEAIVIQFAIIKAVNA